jgi:DNA primase
MTEVAINISSIKMDPQLPEGSGDEMGRAKGEVTPVKRAKLLERVAAFYHQRFLDLTEGQRYLVKDRGIRNLALFRDYRVGYADGSLLEALPRDTESLMQFRFLGVLNGRNRDSFAGCVVFPLFDASGALVNLYGVGIEAGAEPVYLTEARGIWNHQAARRASSLLIVGSIIDALTLIDRGMSDVLPCFSPGGLNEDQLALLSKGTVKTVTLCLAANDARAQAIQKQLGALGIAVQTVVLPDGQDVNAFLVRHEISAFKALLPKAKAAPAKETALNFQRTAQGFVLSCAQRRYEVKAIVRQATQLKAVVKASGERSKGFELRTLDLYSARSRDGYAQDCAALFGEEPATIKADLEQLLEQVEAWMPDSGDAKPAVQAMTDRERDAGLALLREPRLLERIERDLTTLGIAGEAMNKRLCYLAAISRKLDDPLSLLVQSRSAAGKSTLQHAVLSLVPDEDKVIYTRMTDQALFYQDAQGLKHKVVALEEAEGLGGAAYSLRALQSSKQLAIATTSKDPVSGKMKTEQYTVQGPVAVLLTTTSAALDEETASRFLTVTIDESVSMTERIFERQREADTLAGYLRKLDHDALIAQHQAAQRLLEPVAVINPYAKQLRFPAHTLRSRRDHKKYLMLIKAIAFLHQKQRTVKEHAHGDQVLRYIEVTRDDIRAANLIADTVLGQSASELSAPARNLLSHIHKLVKDHCAQQRIAAREYVFTRKAVREGTGWSDWQVRTHMRELEELEYLRARSGAWGKEYSYELACGDQDLEMGAGLALTNPDELTEPA